MSVPASDGMATAAVARKPAKKRMMRMMRHKADLKQVAVVVIKQEIRPIIVINKKTTKVRIRVRKEVEH